MAIEFQLAPVVAVGDPTKSGDYNKLAEAFNSRIASPFDVAWRIAWYLDSATKQVSAPIGDTNEMLARDEFTKIFGHYLQSDHGTWPDPGVPNVAASPLMKYVYGDSNAVVGRVGVGAEDSRTDVVASYLPSSSSTPGGIWTLGKQMRGFMDLASGTYAAPAVTAAQEHFKIAPNTRAKYLVSYGGWQPSPLPDGRLCGDIDETEIYDIFFKSLVAGVPNRHYYGFCPDGSDGAGVENAIRGIYTGPFSWHVYFHAVREPDVLLMSEWTMGPFTGPGRLKHGNSAFIDQTMNRYNSTFRGSLADRATSKYDASKYGFDNQLFLTSQYLLAPSKGTLSGDTVAETTLSHTAAGPSIAAGSMLTGAITDGFVFGGLFVRATGLAAMATISIMIGTSVAAIVTVTPGSPVAYNYSRAGLSGPFTLSNAAAATTEAGGSIYVEILELQEYKPLNHDLNLVLRLGSAPSAMLDSGQEDGDAYSSPKQITADYFQHGMIFNRSSTGLSLIPEDDAAASAFIESARRMTMDHMRMVSGVEDQNQIAKYAVEGGKSVVWFHRYPLVNDARDDAADIFRGIVGEIATTAPARGWTNEWVMVPTWTHGPKNQDAEDSIWKESAFAGPLVAFDNPCHTNSTALEGNFEIRRHINYGLRPILKSEAPSGMNYPGGLGTSTGDIAGRLEPSVALPLHFKGCQIYQQPYRIESCEMDGDLVKVVFTTRFRNHEDFPDGELDSLPDNWPSGTLAVENYQTDEGRIMKFLLWRAGIGATPALTFGDAAYDGLAELQRATGGPSAAVLPKFYFVHLIPKAYEDCNNVTNTATDTVTTVEVMLQMELYSRPMCEAFVDGPTSLTNSCTQAGIPGARLFDYSFENAMVEANGRTWFQTLPTAIVGSNSKGYGPLPRTEFYAEIFNQFSRFINLLTKARIDLPLIMEQRRHNTDGFVVAVNFEDGGNGGATGLAAGTLGPISSFSGWALWDGLAPFTGYQEELSDWENVVPQNGMIAFAAVKESVISSDVWLSSGGNLVWAARGSQLETYWRLKATPESLFAMSSDLLALLPTGGSVLAQEIETLSQTNQWNVDGVGPAISNCPNDVAGTPFPRAGVYVADGNVLTVGPSCVVATSGTVTARDPASGRSSVQIKPNDARCVLGGTSATKTLTIAGGVDSQGRVIVGIGNVFVTIPVVDNDPCAV